MWLTIKELGTHSMVTLQQYNCASLQEISLGFSLNFPSAFPEHFKFQASSSDPVLSLKTLFLAVLSPPEGAKHIFWLSEPGTNFHQVK